MTKKIFLVAGLGFGDEGKGTIVDHLTHIHAADLIVRYNGGSQAAHNIIDTRGTHHCFAQFGSGTLHKNVRTFLSHHMLVNPLSLLQENIVLQNKGIINALQRLIIDKRCIVITPFHKIINRMLERSKGPSHHGSCGKGVGEAYNDSQLLGDMTLTIGDLADPLITKRKLAFLFHIKMDLAEQLFENDPCDPVLKNQMDQMHWVNDIQNLTDMYTAFFAQNGITFADETFLTRELRSSSKTIIFEGAQGALLDPVHGFYPHITKTRTTFINAEDLLNACEYDAHITKIGVLRAYHTRHGNGPFVTESRELTAGIRDMHNTHTQWQGLFRIGWFDAVMARYALDKIGGVDQLYLTNLDRLNGITHIPVCTAYVHRKKHISNLPMEKRSQHHFTNIVKRCIPVYHSMCGWHEVPHKKWDQMPQKMKDYLSFIEEQIDQSIHTISVGPKTTDKIIISPH